MGANRDGTSLDARQRPRSPRRLGMLLLVVAGAALALGSFRTGSAPAVEIDSAVPGIGRKTTVEARLEGTGRGLGDVVIDLVQAERSVRLAERSYQARAPWAFWGARELADVIGLEVGREALGDVLEEGSAVIRVEARPPGAWLRKGDPVVVEREFPVLLRPPPLGVLSSQHYPSQGGSGLVVYSVGDTAVRDGVAVAEDWFPGFALPGAPAGQRFALFAVPFDLESAQAILLVAEDAVGNRVERPFVDRLQRREYEQDQIRLSTGFLEKVVPEIVSNSPSVREADDLLSTYLRINRELRARNAAELAELAAGSRPEFLWTKSFLGLPNAKVMSAFADRRTYVLDGKAVDQQDHLGFDLASVKRAAVPAANRGVVLLARYFGIYGNAVLIDHGYGLMSLYGHLSTLAVQEGEEVARGQLIGRTGETGLAGGDHLHFTLLLQGKAVNPVEWWDESWIDNRVRSKLSPAVITAQGS